MNKPFVRWLVIISVLVGAIAAGCKADDESVTLSDLRQIQIGRIELRIESTLFGHEVTFQGTSIPKFDEGLGGAFLVIPVRMFKSLPQFAQESASDREVTVVVTAASTAVLPESAEANDASGLLLSEGAARGSLRPFSGRMGIVALESDRISYIVLDTTTSEPRYLSRCFEMRGPRGDGPDLCYRQFGTPELSLRIGFSENLAPFALEIEREVRCFLSVWTAAPARKGNRDRYARCSS